MNKRYYVKFLLFWIRVPEFIVKRFPPPGGEE